MNEFVRPRFVPVGPAEQARLDAERAIVGKLNPGGLSARLIEASVRGDRAFGSMRIDAAVQLGRVAKTPEGYLRGDAIITRTGVFHYQNADGSIRRELRHPDDVFSKASLDSFKMLPITKGHPTDQIVSAGNARELAVGFLGENLVIDGAFLIAPLTVTHADAIAAIDAGQRALSCGYSVTLTDEAGDYNGERYTHRQINIRGNHVALCDLGRAGSAARLNMDAFGR